MSTAAESTAPAPLPVTGSFCFTYSWSPEVHDLYGDADTILAKLDGLSLDLGERRVYALMVEGPEQAEIRLFEQVDAERWAVLGWQGRSLGDLHARFDRLVLENRGVHCVGEQAKGLLGESLELELQGVVPRPVSARAAFAHPLRAHGHGGFLRATVALLC